MDPQGAEKEKTEKPPVEDVPADDEILLQYGQKVPFEGSLSAHLQASNDQGNKDAEGEETDVGPEPRECLDGFEPDQSHHGR